MDEGLLTVAFHENTTSYLHPNVGTACRKKSFESEQGCHHTERELHFQKCARMDAANS